MKPILILLFLSGVVTASNKNHTLTDFTHQCYGDILFIVDTSYRTQSILNDLFNTYVNGIVQEVNQCAVGGIGPNGARIAVIHYSDTIQTELIEGLNWYFDNDAANVAYRLSTFRGQDFSGQNDLYTAINLGVTNVFPFGRGLPANYPKFIVFVTDGLFSSQSPFTSPTSLLSTMQSEASNNMYAVKLTLSSGSSYPNVEALVQHPANVYTPATYTQIGTQICNTLTMCSNSQNPQQTTTTTMPTTTTTMPPFSTTCGCLDLIIAIDVSQDMYTNFDDVRTFIADILLSSSTIGTLGNGYSGVRVDVFTFNAGIPDEAYFDQYATTADYQSFARRVGFAGGVSDENFHSFGSSPITTATQIRNAGTNIISVGIPGQTSTGMRYDRDNLAQIAGSYSNVVDGTDLLNPTTQETLINLFNCHRIPYVC